MTHSPIDPLSPPLAALSTTTAMTAADASGVRFGRLHPVTDALSRDALPQGTGERSPALEGLVMRWHVSNPCEVFLPRVAKCPTHGHRQLGVDQQTGDIVCYLCHPELNPHDWIFKASLRPVAPVVSVPRTPSIFDSIPRDPCPVCVSLSYRWNEEQEVWFCDHGEERKRLAAARRKRKATKRRKVDPVPLEPVGSQATGNGTAPRDASPASVGSRGQSEQAAMAI